MGVGKGAAAHADGRVGVGLVAALEAGRSGLRLEGQVAAQRSNYAAAHLAVLSRPRSVVCPDGKAGLGRGGGCIAGGTGCRGR